MDFGGSVMGGSTVMLIMNIDMHDPHKPCVVPACP